MQQLSCQGKLPHQNQNYLEQLSYDNDANDAMTKLGIFLYTK